MKSIISLTADLQDECLDINLQIDPSLSFPAQRTYLEILMQVINRTQKEIKQKELESQPAIETDFTHQALIGQAKSDAVIAPYTIDDLPY